MHREVLLTRKVSPRSLYMFVHSQWDEILSFRKTCSHPFCMIFLYVILGWCHNIWDEILLWFSSVFDRSLVESGPRNSFAVVRVKCFVPFAQILVYFTMFWFETSLDMFVELYQITS